MQEVLQSGCWLMEMGNMFVLASTEYHFLSSFGRSFPGGNVLIQTHRSPILLSTWVGPSADFQITLCSGLLSVLLSCKREPRWSTCTRLYLLTQGSARLCLHPDTCARQHTGAHLIFFLYLWTTVLDCLNASVVKPVILYILSFFVVLDSRVNVVPVIPFSAGSGGSIHKGCVCTCAFFRERAPPASARVSTGWVAPHKGRCHSFTHGLRSFYCPDCFVWQYISSRF